MSHSPSFPLEAVFLFQGDQLLRELLYPEFEAILDGFIPIPEYAGTAARAVYVQINSQLLITGTVFFLLGFDAKGLVDSRWNLPLQQMLMSASPGPDLGAGAIRLACYSQCPMDWHQKNLWDPQMTPGRNSFIALRKSVKANRLGFAVRPVEPTATQRQEDDHIPTLQPLSLEDFEREQQALQQQLHEHYAQDMRAKVARLIKEQRLRIATLTNEHKTRTQSLHSEHQNRLQSYQQRLQELETEKRELEERNQALRENLDVQANKIEGIREYFAHKLEAAQSGENSQFQTLQDNFALELDIKIQAATADLREMLEMREVELFYRHQNESALKEEIVNLKRESQALIKNGADQLLGRMAKAGISFVSFQPGIGQLTIAADDMARFLDNPRTFAAEKSGVSDALYIAWLEHSETPCCNAVDHRGHRCGAPVAPVDSPLEFHPGESDKCEQHQTISFQWVAEGR